MRNIQTWYWQEVERWRMGAAVTWGILLTPVALLFFMVLAQASLSIPLLWVIYGLGSVLSPEKWTYIFTLVVVMAAIAICDAKYATVRPTILRNRLEYLRSTCSPHKVLLVVAHGVVGCIATWCYVSILGGRYSSLTIDMGQLGFYLNEYHLFLVVHGGFVGIVYALYFFMGNQYQLTFPIIQQAKFFQVKSSVYPLLQTSLANTLSALRIFYPAYYLILGSFIKGVILQNLALHRAAVAVDSLRGLLDLGLIWQVILSGTLLHVLFSLGNLLQCIYQTELYAFELDSDLEEEKAWCLNKAMDCANYPLLQCVGFMDLHRLSQQAGARRQFMFQLSQPGGHPHNWTATSTQCLVQLKALAESLQGLNDKVMAQGPTRQRSGDKPAYIATPSHQGDVASKPVEPLSSKILGQLKKWKAVSFFLDELPDTATRCLFVDCQLYIWAVEALSNLVCASYTEDKYGVVQKSLPDILVTLLTLQEAVEKHMKWCPLAVNRKGGKLSTSADLRAAFRATLKGSIYHIVATFHEHLRVLPLSTEHMRRMQQFLDYKE